MQQIQVNTKGEARNPIMQNSRGKDKDTSIIMYHEKISEHHLQYDEEENSLSNTYQKRRK